MHICELIANGDKGLHTLHHNDPDNVPEPATIYNWMDENEEFLKLYARARERQAEFLANQIVDISDDKSEDIIITDDGKKLFNGEFAARSRLRVDARKWLASKLAPKKYGDKVDVTSGGEAVAFNVTLPKPDGDRQD